MPGFIAKSFESPDEVRSPDKTKVEVVDLGRHQGRPIEGRAGLAVVRVHQARRRHRVVPGPPCRCDRLGRDAHRPQRRHRRRRHTGHGLRHRAGPRRMGRRQRTGDRVRVRQLNGPDLRQAVLATSNDDGERIGRRPRGGAATGGSRDAPRPVTRTGRDHASIYRGMRSAGVSVTPGTKSHRPQERRSEARTRPHG